MLSIVDVVSRLFDVVMIGAFVAIVLVTGAAIKKIAARFLRWLQAKLSS
jgi:hypothetical protein